MSHFPHSPLDAPTPVGLNAVEVQDTFPPTWTNCPSGNIVVPVIATGNSQRVFWTVPTPSDNRVVAFWNSTHESGDVFFVTPLGSSGTLVTYRAVDDAGLVALCTFRVVVQDTTPPSIVCPAAEIPVSMDTHQPFATVRDSAVEPVTYSDNDGVPTLQPLTQRNFSQGTHTLMRVVTDRSGNSANCSLSIRVEDTEKPQFSDCGGVVQTQTLVVMKDADNIAWVVWTLPHSSDNVNITDVTLSDITVPAQVAPVTSNFSVAFAGSSTTRVVRVLVGDAAGNTNQCDVTLSIATSAASVNNNASSSSNNTYLIAGVIAGAAAALLALLVALHQRRKRHRKIPHDFAGILSLMQGLPSTLTPREIRREHVTIVGNLGKGNFGSVDKAMLDEQRAMGIPAYLVAVKQLLSKRTEDRTSLLEEAAIMAQFQHAHCVQLIGVVTVGDPLMVRVFFFFFFFFFGCVVVVCCCSVVRCVVRCVFLLVCCIGVLKPILSFLAGGAGVLRVWRTR